MLKQFFKAKIHVWVVLLVALILVTATIAVQLGWLGFKNPFSHKSNETENISVTVEKTLPISELNGLLVSTDRVIQSEKDGWPLIGGKRMLVVASWNVRLGIDGSKIKISADEDKKSIEVRLPKLTVTSEELAKTPHVYDQRGSLLDKYSPQDVLDAVNAKSDEVKSDVLKDKDYRQQATSSLKETLSAVINGAPGVKGNYEIVYVTE